MGTIALAAGGLVWQNRVGFEKEIVMKKILALVIASGALLAATPVFACPNHDSDKTETAAAPKKSDDATAAKAKDQKAPTTDTKAADKSKPAPAPKAAAKG